MRPARCKKYQSLQAKPVPVTTASTSLLCFCHFIPEKRSDFGRAGHTLGSRSEAQANRYIRDLEACRQMLAARFACRAVATFALQ
jgi:hypothetical protein